MSENEKTQDFDLRLFMLQRDFSSAHCFLMKCEDFVSPAVDAIQFLRGDF